MSFNLKQSVFASGFSLAVGLLVSCSSTEAAGQLEAKYDQTTGKLSELTMNTRTDGKPTVFSFMEGARFIRIEIDSDENGSIDRWEYYGADQKLEKVGISRSNDGVVDAWLFEGPNGQPSKVEISTKRDGRVDRTEFYTDGQLARVETDTDLDGHVDKWETYQGASLAAVSFDLTRSGKPTVTIDYRDTKR
jgi:hypothetical protein